MSASKIKISTLEKEKENLQYCLVKIKFAVCKLFKQILHKDTNSNNNTINEQQEQQQQLKVNSNQGSCIKFSCEIEQNLANERLVKSWLQQPYVLAM